jgi:acetoin utilization protein AcuB
MLVKNWMNTNVVTIDVNNSMQDATKVLKENDVDMLPVMEKGKLVGVITDTDLKEASASDATTLDIHELVYLISLTGLAKRGIQFAFQLEDQPGSIKELADIIRKYGGRMAGILTSYDDVPEGYRNVYIRMYGIDRFKLNDLKRELADKAKMLYWVDLRGGTREIMTT